MKRIPIQPIPNQIIKVVLGGQNVQIAIYYKEQGLFCDVNSNGDNIVNGIRIINGVPIVCIQYNGFVGNIMMVDTEGSQDPSYLFLGTRYQLIYLEASDVA